MDKFCGFKLRKYYYIRLLYYYIITLEKRQGCNLVTDFQSLKNKNRTQNGKHRTSSFFISLKNAL